MNKKQALLWMIILWMITYITSISKTKNQNFTKLAEIKNNYTQFELDKKMDIYLAGVFDVRGFININLNPDEKGRTKFNVYFNYTDTDSHIFEQIQEMLQKEGIKSSIYKVRRKKGKKKEYLLYITNRHDSVKFLKRILPYSLSKTKIMEALNKLNTHET